MIIHLQKNFLMLLMLLCINGKCLAGDLLLEGFVGAAFVDNDNYTGTGSMDQAIGYTSNKLSFRLGVNRADFAHKSQDDNNFQFLKFGAPATGIRVDAWYLSLTKNIEFYDLQLEFGGGAFFSQSKIYLDDRKISKTSDQSPFINVKLVKPLGSFFALQGDWKFINDVTGANINLVQIGFLFIL